MSKTPFEQAGYTKDTKFKLLMDYNSYKKGDIVTLHRDDGSDCPMFTDGKGNYHYVYLPNMRPTGDQRMEVYVEEATKIKFPIMKKKVGIFGYARHGKDSVAEMLARKLDYQFCSSSLFVCEKAVYPFLAPKYGYRTFTDCFEDRVNHRAEWKELITFYNKEDKARLAKELLVENDIYVGMRCKDELQACIEQGIFDIIIWVTNPRKPVESVASCTIRYEDFEWDVIIPNQFSLRYLQDQVDLIVREEIFECH